MTMLVKFTGNRQVTKRKKKREKKEAVAYEGVPS
jgi:hypothetical protein